MSEPQWWAKHREASARFAAIPGVIGVGLGIKETARKPTGEVALIVYVEKKKPPSDLDPVERLPAEFQGMPVDVQRAINSGMAFGGTTLDGGAQIRATPDDNDRPKPGTLGYIATRVSDSAPVMLSCDHVILSRRSPDRRIFHPDASPCCGKLKNAVGHVVAGRQGIVGYTNANGPNDYFMDAAIGEIDDGVTPRKFIPDVGPIVGPRDITATPVGPGNQTITVRKRGAESGVTEGTVEDVAMPMSMGLGRPTIPRLIKIRPIAGKSFDFTITWRVPEEDVAALLVDFPANSLGGTATQVGTDKVRFDVPVFAVPGDSGAALVDVDSERIVGLILAGDIYPVRAYKEGRLGTGAVPNGFVVGTHLPPALDQLGIRIDASTVPAAGRRSVVPGADIAAEPPDRIAAMSARLARIEADLEQGANGRQVNALLRRHADELIDLVHHRRPVLVTWNRNRGPAFMALILKALLDESETTLLPGEISGVSREALLRRMRAVLMREGSPGLRADMARHEDVLLPLLTECDSVASLRERLR